MASLSEILTGGDPIQVEAKVPQENLLAIGATLFLAIALAIIVGVVTNRIIS